MNILTGKLAAVAHNFIPAVSFSASICSPLFSFLLNGLVQQFRQMVNGINGPVGGGVKLYVLHKPCLLYSLVVDVFLYHNRFIYCLKFDDNNGATIATTHINGINLTK